jgi:hypothetical protein
MIEKVDVALNLTIARPFRSGAGPVNMHREVPDARPHALARVAEIPGGWRDQRRQGLVPRSFKFNLERNLVYEGER